jgi:beta-lactamase regulating signal transducer with metallopeptidase domain
MVDLRRFIQPAAPWIVGAWVIGAVLLSLWRLGGWLYLHRLSHRGISPAPESVQAALDRLHRRLGVHRAVRLLESAYVHVPAVVGWLRPVILLPIGLVAGITPDQLELILAHELAHIRRRDFLANLIQTAIETCLFYHPAVWWVSRMIRIEREACCDDLVVATTGERLSYARALVRLAEVCIEPRGARLERLPVAADGGDLLSRIRRIVGITDGDHQWTLPRLAGSIAVLGIMAVLAGYMAVAVEPRVTAAPTPQVEAKAAPAAARAEGEHPRLVELHPADGATDVEPETNLRIRFDRPMDPTLAVLEWDFRGQAGFHLRGPLRYDPTSHEFTLPVRLTPGRQHVVTLNRKGTVKEEASEGFRAAGGLAMAPVRWTFTTAGPKPAAVGPVPRAVSVSPASDTEAALLTPVEVTFDQPMDPASYRVTVPDQPVIVRNPVLTDQVEYDAAAKRFTLLLRLPPNWYGELRLEGFRSAQGVEAEPIALKYRTLREPLAPSLRRRVEQAGQSARLRALIERIREARRNLSSVSETVVTVYTFQSGMPDWYGRYESEGATFQMQGRDKFVAVIDEIMHVPFRVGSDGTTCWFVGSDKTIALPSRAIDDKNVLVADPFDATGGTDVDKLIREWKLEYAGEVDLDGRRCHLIRSWQVSLPGDSMVILGPRWSIDAATLLPVRVAHGDSFRLDYTYTRINQPIPDAEFRPSVGAEIQVANPEPLPEGYTRRFLNVIDGTNGRMSVRWGMTGPKGRNSSGLN